MIELLRRSWVALVVLVLALVAQIPHAAYVFDGLVGQQGTVLGLAYAVALEFAVLMFVIHGRNFESYLFAGASILVNLSYYSMHEVTVWGAGVSLPAWLVSLMLPVAIARYSHIVADAKDDMHELTDAWAWVQGQWARLVAWWKGAPVASAVASHPVGGTDATKEEMQPEGVQPVDASIDKRARALHLFSEGLTVAQVAAELDAPIGTVKSWKQRMNGHKVT